LHLLIEHEVLDAEEFMAGRSGGLSSFLGDAAFLIYIG
jgi:hypothetical protein